MTIMEYSLSGFLLATVIAWAVEHSRRLRDVERKVTVLLCHFKIDPNSPVEPSSHVHTLALDPEQRIAAIKAYRIQTGAGLREAAAVIDEIANGKSETGTH